MGQDKVKGRFLTHTLAISTKYLVWLCSWLLILCSPNIYRLSLNSSIYDIFAQIPLFPLKWTWLFLSCLCLYWMELFIFYLPSATKGGAHAGNWCSAPHEKTCTARKTTYKHAHTPSAWFLLATSYSASEVMGSVWKKHELSRSTQGDVLQQLLSAEGNGTLPNCGCLWSPWVIYFHMCRADMLLQLFSSKGLGFSMCSSSLGWGANLVPGCKASPPGCPLQQLPMEQGAAVIHKLLYQSALFTKEYIYFFFSTWFSVVPLTTDLNKVNSNIHILKIPNILMLRHWIIHCFCYPEKI